MNLAQYLDATYLSLDVLQVEQERQVQLLAENVKSYSLRGICVRPQWVKTCKELLKDYNCEIASVIAFPTEKSTIQQQFENPTFGNVSTPEKINQVQEAFLLGATEVDVVLNTRFYNQDNVALFQTVYDEVLALQNACEHKRLKLILECDLLCADKLSVVMDGCLKAKVDCLKNATGYILDGKGATPDLIHKIKTRIVASIQPGTLLKASAGIKTHAQANMLIEAGADILGTSSIETILNLSSDSLLPSGY